MPYTPAQVSEMLNIPPSTLRRLSSELAELLSEQKTRKRKYTESDIAILKKARELTGQGASISEIRQVLSVVGDTPAREQEVSDTLALVPGISTELERLDSGYRQVMRELEQLRGERDADRERIKQLEERLEALSLPWWKRILPKK